MWMWQQYWTLITICKSARNIQKCKHWGLNGLHGPHFPVTQPPQRARNNSLNYQGRTREKQHRARDPFIHGGRATADGQTYRSHYKQNSFSQENRKQTMSSGGAGCTRRHRRPYTLHYWHYKLLTVCLKCPGHSHVQCGPCGAHCTGGQRVSPEVVQCAKVDAQRAGRVRGQVQVEACEGKASVPGGMCEGRCEIRLQGEVLPAFTSTTPTASL